MSVTKKEKEKASVYSGAQQPQSMRENKKMPGAQQPQAYGNGQTVTIIKETFLLTDIMRHFRWSSEESLTHTIVHNDINDDLH